MSADIEVSVDGFQQAFASRAVPAWHGLGTVFAEEDEVTTARMLELAHLDNWDVRQELVTMPEDWRATTDAYFTIRTNPFDGGTDVLGIAGERYRVVQNEELFAFGDNIVHNGARWETAGAIKHGKVVFASVALDDDLVLDPNGRNDKVSKFLLLQTSHDGSTAVVAAITNIRVVCKNTLNLALSGAKQTFKVRHTTTVQGRVQEAREALDLTVAYNAKFEEAAQAMIQTEITKATFDDLVATLYPAPTNESKAAATRHGKKTELLEAIYLGTADGPDTQANITGTAWGALNALTEAVDWYRKPRKGSAEAVMAAASGMDPVTTAEKNRIFKAVKALV